MAKAVSPGTRFRYRCLGPAELRGPSGRALPLRTRKHRALLYVLARKAGEPTSRDVLVELLWPDAGGARAARHSLAQSASLINKALGAEVIVPAGKDLITMREGVLSVDALDFEHHAANGRPEEAIALWSGDLLEGLWVRGAPTFERYLAEERERLRRVLRNVLKDLIESRQRAGDWAAMRAAAEKLLEVDPLDEGAMLRYLEALILLDDRTLALRRYGEFERRLKEELDAEPGEGLRRWIRTHRSGCLKAPDNTVGRVRENYLQPLAQPLLGRDREFSSLWAAWEAAKRGSGQFLVLEGEAGIGKTALVSKLANQVRVEGGSVTFVRCYRTEKAVPFGTVTGLLRQLSHLPGFVGTAPAWIGELTRLMPELRERYPACPPPLQVDDSARLRLIDATVAAAQSVSVEAPLLVVIDDVPNADDASLALIHYLGRQLDSIHLQLVCTARNSAPGTAVERTFFETAELGRFATFLRLGALGHPHVERLAQLVLAHRGHEPTPTMVSQVVAAAQGNPLDAIEAALSLDPPSCTGVQRQAPAAAHSFDRSSQGRLRGLSTEAQLVASILALAGRPLSEYELAVFSSLPPAELAAAIGILEAERFARRVGGVITFAHDRYIEAAEALTTGDLRSRLHLRIAEHLAQTAAGNPAAHYEVAVHFARAGEADSARTEASRAIQYAASIGAATSKAEALRLLLDLGPGFDEGTASSLAYCYLGSNDLQALRNLSSEAKCLGVPSPNLAYCEVAAGLQDGSMSLAQVQTALQALTDENHSFTLRDDAMILLMRVADKTRDYALAKRIPRDLRSKGLTPHALLASSFVFLKYYSPARAIPLLSRALKSAQEDGLWPLEHVCREGLAIALKQIGRYRESIKESEYSVGLARRTLSAQAEALCLQNRAVSEMSLGEFDCALATHQEVRRVGAAFSDQPYRLFLNYNEGIIKLYRGQWDAAESTFRDVIADSQRVGNRVATQVAAGGLAITLARTMDVDGLAEAAGLIKENVGTGDKYTLAWTDCAGIAYYHALCEHDPISARSVLDARKPRLRRQDVSLWLALALEAIAINEIVEGGRAYRARQDFMATAGTYEAKAMIAVAASNNMCL